MIKVTDNKGISGVDKKKKDKNAEAAKGADFASMLARAGAARNAEEQGGFGGNMGGGSAFYGQMEPDVPKDAKGRSAYLLQTLQELEHDILTGNPTAAVKKLKQALQTQAIDYADLPPHMKQLVDEIDLRASVEVAKMEN